MMENNKVEVEVVVAERLERRKRERKRGRLIKQNVSRMINQIHTRLIQKIYIQSPRSLTHAFQVQCLTNFILFSHKNSAKLSYDKSSNSN
jgi:hypothetical protein